MIHGFPRYNSSFPLIYIIFIHIPIANTHTLNVYAQTLSQYTTKPFYYTLNFKNKKGTRTLAKQQMSIRIPRNTISAKTSIVLLYSSAHSLVISTILCGFHSNSLLILINLIVLYNSYI